MRARGALSAALLLGSCEPDDEGQRVSGVHVHVHVSTGIEADMCGGSIAYMDAHVERVAGVLGLDAARVDYEWMSEAETQAVCDPNSACYSSFRDKVYSSRMPHAHELVHAVLLGGGFSPDHFLSEGLAVVFADNVPLDNNGLVASIFDVLSFPSMPKVNIPPDYYGRSAHFVAFLLDTYGEEAIWELASQQWAGHPEAEQSEVMVAATGDTLAEVLERYAMVPDCSVLEFRKALVECAEDPVPWTDLPFRAWSAAIPMTCERDDVRGPWGTRMWTSRTFDVATEGEFELTAYSAGESGEVIVRRCDSRCDDSFRVVLGSGKAERHALRAGRHVVTLLRDVDHPGEIGLVVVPVAD